MVSKDAVRLVALIVMLTAAVSVRADSLPPLSSGGPSGYWSFGPYQSGSDPSGSTMFGLSGVGQMTDLTFGSWSNPQSGTVFTDLTWQPDKLTLGPEFGPIIVKWTSLSAGDYTVTATVSPSLTASGSSGGQFSSFATPFVGGLDPANPSGPFSQTVSFAVGDSIGFVTSGGGSTDKSAGFLVSFSPALAPQVPEPSTEVALLGLCGMGLMGAIWACRRERICRAH
jgi:PEP-CTERM motif